MIIAMKKAPKTGTFRDVSMYGKVYRFAPIGGDGKFVANVTNEDHIRRFIVGNAEHYEQATGGASMSRGAPTPPAKPVVVDPNGGKDPADVNTGGADPLVNDLTPAEQKILDDAKADELRQAQDAANAGSDDPEVFGEEVKAEAGVLLGKPLNTLATRIGKVSAPTVIRCALALEQSGEGGGRPAAVKLLQDTVEALRLAQVQG